MKNWKKMGIHPFGISVLGLLILVMGVFSCEQPTKPESSYSVNVSGVVNRLNGSPLDSVVITLSDPFRKDTTKSDGTFKYSFITSEQNEVTAKFNLSHLNLSYVDTFYTAVYSPTKKTVALGELKMRGKTPSLDSVVTGKPSARAGVIVFLRSTYPSISIRGAGANDATNLTFEVRDSLGIPVDEKNKVSVAFKLITKLDSLTELNRASAITNSIGQVVVQLSAGNKAGIAQVQATTTVKNAVDTTKTDTLKSQVVSVTIAGGLPVASRFTLGAEKYNIPGGVIFNYRDIITAVVGDTFGNPVQKGTKVYFTTTGGVIQSAAETNDDGIVSVELITGNPVPLNGFAVVTAQVGTPGGYSASNSSDRIQEKFDEEVIIKDLRKNKITKKNLKADNVILSAPTVFQKSISVLFSGYTIVSFLDSSFSVPVGATQDIKFTVSDINGNPLTSGTTISVKAEPTNAVELDGDKDIKLPDTFDRSFTQFKVRLSDKRTTGLSQSTPVSLTISVVSQNRDAKNTLSGFVLGTGGITVDSSQVGRIAVVDPIPDTLLVSGTGVSYSKDVEFKVYNIFGLPAKNVPVTFEITKEVGGGEYVTPASAITDFEGKVKTSVVSGIQYGIIHVQAKAKRDTLTIMSDPKIFHIKIPKGTRLASQVSFLSVSASDIKIAGVGGVENSAISYVVKDSFGIPIDRERRAFATFNMRFEPTSVGGGTAPVLLPSFDSTDDNGKLTTRVVSGTQAGVVTVEVIINLPGRPSVKSLPVKISVHAGFADRGHFSLIPSRYVFPGHTLSTQPGFTVVVGDTFSNPVDKGTAILFSTQAGVIQTGSDDFNAYTDKNGIAFVNLLPVNPTPDDVGTVLAGRPTFDTLLSNGRRGYHWVYARTQGRFGPVKDSVLVVQAIGPIQITGIPDSVINIDSTNYSSIISFTVKDARGNPLPDGTTITAFVQLPSDPPSGLLVDVTGDLPAVIPNAGFARFPGNGITNFSFRVVNASTFNMSGNSVSVKVTVSSGIGSVTRGFVAKIL